MNKLTGIVKQAYGRTGIQLNESPESLAVVALTGKKLITPEHVKALSVLGYSIAVTVDVPTFEGVEVVVNTPKS